MWQNLDYTFLMTMQGEWLINRDNFQTEISKMGTFANLIKLYQGINENVINNIYTINLWNTYSKSKKFILFEKVNKQHQLLENIKNFA